MTPDTVGIISSPDGIVDGHQISQETLEQLEPIRRAVGIDLIRQGRWILRA